MKLEEVIKTYETENGNNVKALNGVTLSFEKKTFYAIIGESGSGKSTLINVLGLMDDVTRGKYIFGGVDVSELSSDEKADIRNKKIGFVFQNFYLNGRLTAFENVLLPTLINKEHTKEEYLNKAKSLFEKFGLIERMDHYPSELSGGEQQRVSIIRALINDPEYILADEPTGNLDHKNEGEILKYLKEISKEGKCVIVVSHNPNIKKYAGKIINIDKGVIISES